MKLLTFITFLLAGLIHAQGIGFDDFDSGFGSSGNSTSEAVFLSEVENFVPGKPFEVALKINHPDGWHSYYKNSGGYGLPPTFEWTLPEGWVASEIKFQTPHRIESLGEIGYSYEGEIFLFTTITPPKDTRTGEISTIKLKANWQICKTQCVFEPGPGPGDFADYELKVTAAEDEKLSDASEELKAAAAHLPVDAPEWKIAARKAGKSYILEIEPPAALKDKIESFYFFSAQPGVFDANAEQALEFKDGLYRLDIPKQEKAGKIGPLSGILEVTAKDGQTLPFHSIAITELEPTIADAEDLYEDLALGPFLLIIGGMMFGGLILNLMPCVFPVIGLKIMGFVNQASDDRKKIISHGIVFTAGVLLSFWVLSGILLALREKALRGDGAEVGWGYQLQNPWMVWGLLLVMFILGLNMFGLFEIGTKATSVGGNLQAKQGLSGTFFSGVLATVVATPCSAPFLGAAIGAAFALPPVKFMLAFTAMAVGLALPYILLSLFPKLVEKLPRPGAWMESFKQGMSFLLFGTAGYLAWVYLAQIDTFHGLSVFMGLTAIGIAAWVYGRWTQGPKPKSQKTKSGIIAILLLGGGLVLSRPVLEANIPWQKWSEEAVTEALAEGRPVYIDYTAQWCLTCQLNKSRAYNDEVAEAFLERNVLMLRADKTNTSPEIEKSLKKLGRTAIPVNVLHLPGEDEPIITPEILSSDYLLELLKERVKAPEE